MKTVLTSTTYKKMKEHQDLSLVSDAAYRLAELIDGHHYDNIIVYEFHEAINPSSAFNSESGLESFRARNLKMGIYKNFLTSGLIDQFPAIIHIAIKISSVWFFSEDFGYNYSLGYGPSGIIKLREACHKNGVRIFALDEPFKEWKENFLGIDSKNSNEKITTRRSRKESSSKTDTNDSKIREGKQFKKIIQSIQHLTTTMQDEPQSYQGMNEDNIRDKMFTTLNVIFKGRVSREAKNCKGKTDISITTKDGKSKHIFELKVWHGPKSLRDAIIQLQGYLSSHHNYAGVIVFCYELGFTNLLKKAKQELVKEYKYFPSSSYSKNEFHFNLPHLTDKEQIIQTHLTMVNLKC